MVLSVCYRLFLVPNHLQRNQSIKQRKNTIFPSNLKLRYFSSILLHSSETAHIIWFCIGLADTYLSQQTTAWVRPNYKGQRPRHPAMKPGL